MGPYYRQVYIYSKDPLWKPDPDQLKQFISGFYPDYQNDSEIFPLFSIEDETPTAESIKLHQKANTEFLQKHKENYWLAYESYPKGKKVRAYLNPYGLLYQKLETQTPAEIMKSLSDSAVLELFEEKAFRDVYAFLDRFDSVSRFQKNVDKFVDETVGFELIFSFIPSWIHREFDRLKFGMAPEEIKVNYGPHIIIKNDMYEDSWSIEDNEHPEFDIASFSIELIIRSNGYYGAKSDLNEHYNFTYKERTFKKAIDVELLINPDLRKLTNMYEYIFAQPCVMHYNEMTE